MPAPAPSIPARARNFALIALITVLVWLLAESESLRVEKVQVHLSFRADPDSDRAIRVEPAQDFAGTVTVRLEGSTAKVDALAAALRKEIRLEPGTEGFPMPVAPDSTATSRVTVQLQAALSALPLVRNSGVVIAEADPPTVNLTIDRLITRDCTVRVELPPGQALEGAPEVSPASVVLRAPAALSLPADAQLIARVDAAAIASLNEGRRTTLAGIPLELPESLRGADPSSIRLSPPQVSISLSLRSRSSSVILPTIPVQFRLAPTELGIWDIQLAPESRLLTDVAVSGPADLIDQLRTEKLKPVASVALSFEDLERAAAAGTPIEKEVSFSDLPTTLKFEAKQKTVKVTVKRREAATPAATRPGG